MNAAALLLSTFACAAASSGSSEVALLDAGSGAFPAVPKWPLPDFRLNWNFSAGLDVGEDGVAGLTAGIDGDIEAAVITSGDAKDQGIKFHAGMATHAGVEAGVLHAGLELEADFNASTKPCDLTTVLLTFNPTISIKMNSGRDCTGIHGLSTPRPNIFQCLYGISETKPALEPFCVDTNGAKSTTTCDHLKIGLPEPWTKTVDISKDLSKLQLKLSTLLGPQGKVLALLGTDLVWSIDKLESFFTGVAAFVLQDFYVVDISKMEGIPSSVKTIISSTLGLEKPLFQKKDRILKTIEDGMKKADANFKFPPFLAQVPGAITIGSVPKDMPQCSKNVTKLSFKIDQSSSTKDAAGVQQELGKQINKYLSGWGNASGIAFDGKCNGNGALDTECPFQNVTVTAGENANDPMTVNAVIKATAGLNAAGLGQIASNLLVQTANSGKSGSGSSSLLSSVSDTDGTDALLSATGSGSDSTASIVFEAFTTDGDISGIQTCTSADRAKFDAFHGCGPKAMPSSYTKPGGAAAMLGEWWFWVAIAAAVALVVGVCCYCRRKKAPKTNQEGGLRA